MMICAICGTGDETVLVQHHIVPRNKGGSDNPSNLITLCRNCHWKVHRGIYSLKPKFTDLEFSIISQVVENPKPTVWRIASKLETSSRAVGAALTRIAFKILSDPTMLKQVQLISVEEVGE